MNEREQNKKELYCIRFNHQGTCRECEFNNFDECLDPCDGNCEECTRDYDDCINQVYKLDNGSDMRNQLVLGCRENEELNEFVFNIPAYSRTYYFNLKVRDYLNLILFTKDSVELGFRVCLQTYKYLSKYCKFVKLSDILSLTMEYTINLIIDKIIYDAKYMIVDFLKLENMNVSDDTIMSVGGALFEQFFCFINSHQNLLEIYEHNIYVFLMSRHYVFIDDSDNNKFIKFLEINNSYLEDTHLVVNYSRCITDNFYGFDLNTVNKFGYTYKEYCVYRFDNIRKEANEEGF